MRHCPRKAPEGSPRLRPTQAWMLGLLLAPGIAFATLGQDASTVEQDRAQLRAQRAVTASTGYSVHELTMPTGTLVREYLDAKQQVFAVAWSGPFIPDLQQLLGGYFSRYQAATHALGRSRKGVAVAESDLVIHTGGHMRAFFGVAYLPGRLPAGVTAEQIR